MAVRTSCHEHGAKVSSKLLEERVGFLPDDGLTELSDLAEDGEVGVHVDARPRLGGRQREDQGHAATSRR